MAEVSKLRDQVFVTFDRKKGGILLFDLFFAVLFKLTTFCLQLLHFLDGNSKQHNNQNFEIQPEVS